MENFLNQHGLWAVWVGSLVERDIVCVLAGMLAHRQVFSIGAGIAVALSAAFCADLFLYAMGRKHSAWIQQFSTYVRAKRRLERLNKKFGPGAVIVSQFLYGTRTATMIFFGLHEIPFKTFLLFDLAGCLLLVVFLEFLGFYLSDSAELFLGKAKAIEGWLLGGVVISAALIWIGARLFRKWFGDEIDV